MPNQHNDTYNDWKDAQEADPKSLPCRGLFGALFGHNYQARYSVKPVGNLKGGAYTTANEFVRIIEAATEKTYEGDVCPRCGSIINKKDN